MAGATPQTQQPNQFDELKDIVSATLEKQGILAKVQAQLRKHVFEALSVTEQQDKEKYNLSPQIDETDVNDKFAMALIRDFLSYHHLDYTLSLMNTESQKKLEKTQNITRNEIASRLGLGAQKPNPDCSLLHQLVKKLFDNDVLRPRNSTLSQDIKLKPRPSNDSYRSTLDSVSLSKDTIVFQQNKAEKQEDQKIRNMEDKNYTNPLENLTFSGSLTMSNNLPPIGMKKTEINGDKEDDDDEVDLSILEPDEQGTDKTEEVEDEDVIDPLEDLLDSSSNNSQGAENEDGDEEEEEVQAGEENEDEELKRIKQMNKAMEQLRQQTTEFEKLKKESISPSVTEYDDDDFGSEEMDDDNQEKESKTTTEQNDDDTDIEIDIEEDIDEDIEIDADSTVISNDTETADNIYSAKDEDDSLAKDVKLENVADIIMDLKAEKIKFQL